MGKTRAILSALVEAILAVILYAVFDEVKRTLTLLSGATISVRDATIGITVLLAIAVSTAVLTYSIIDALRGKSRVAQPETTDRITRLDDFHARINRYEFEPNETVFFSVKFKGQLRAGFYESVITSLDGKVEYSWDPQTLPFLRAETPGKLSGKIDHQDWRWGWAIPANAHLGEYTAYIGVYDTYPLDWGTKIRAHFLRNWLVRKVIRKRTGPIAAPARPPVAQETIKFTVVRQRKGLERIEGIHAYLFFPIGTPKENMTLDYHRKNLKHRLIVNRKTNPPEPFYLTTDSFGWELISRFTDLWSAHSDPSPYDDGFTERWCKERGWKLNPFNASENDLVRTTNSSSQSSSL